MRKYRFALNIGRDHRTVVSYVGVMFLNSSAEIRITTGFTDL